MAEMLAAPDCFRVLVVERDHQYATWVHAALARATHSRFEIELHHDLSGAVAALAVTDYQALLLSLAAHEPSGLDDIARITPLARRMPILVLSDMDDEGSALQAMRAGADDYLIKGRINEVALVRVVRYAIERRRAELALRENEERFRRLAENAPDIIYRYDLSPHRGLSYVSPAVTAILGYTPAELYANLVQSKQTVDPADYTRLKAMLTGQPSTEPVSVRMRHRDGGLVWTEHRAVPIVGADGTIVAIEGIVRDMTERRLIENQLTQAEKLRSLGVMAAGVAHQMNNVLASILGRADTLLAQLPGGAVSVDDLRHELDAIVKAAQDGAASVTRIQGFSRTELHETPASLDLVLAVRDAVDATGPRWRDQAEHEGRTITVGIDADRPVWVNGVASDLREALTNLILNAVDAMAAGGTIRLTVGIVANRAVVTVADSGEGMTEDILKRAFDPFFTTKAFGAGTGLGLALTHSIVRRHEGTIEIQSQPGQGTRVEIALPLSPPPVPILKVVPLPLAALRILVIDDHPDLATQLGKMLRLDGNDATVCSNPVEALALLDHDTFDVVITDLGMPGCTGWDIAAETRRLQPAAHVILATGWGHEIQEGADLVARGVDAVVAKPYRLETIRTALRTTMQPAAALSCSA